MNMHGHKIILANWKSQKTLAEAQEWVKAIAPKTKDSPYTVIVCPPFPFIPVMQYFMNSTKSTLKLGTQDVSPFPAGAYTGAVSTHNLQELGVSYSLIGHSERRRYFHETYQEVANKADLAVQAGITPIICLRKEDITPQVSAMTEESRKKSMILYETVGHIGTGEVEDMDSVLSAVKEIRKAFGFEIPVLYGGSVDEKTIKTFLLQKELAGVGIGSGSLDPEKFARCIA